MGQDAADTGEGYVYVLEAVGTQWVKIGESRDPFGRIPALQTGCPFPIRLRCCFWSSNRKALEGYLHDHCKEFRGYGEWFAASSPVVSRLVNAPWEAMGGDTLPDFGFKDRVIAAPVRSTDEIPF